MLHNERFFPIQFPFARCFCHTHGNRAFYKAFNRCRNNQVIIFFHQLTGCFHPIQLFCHKLLHCFCIRLIDFGQSHKIQTLHHTMHCRSTKCTRIHQRYGSLFFVPFSGKIRHIRFMFFQQEFRHLRFTLRLIVL